MTLTYDDAHLPPDGDVDAAIKNVQKYIRRINYQRKKRGLPNAKYVYVTAYNPDAEIRWHHHIVMDGALDMTDAESQTEAEAKVDAAVKKAESAARKAEQAAKACDGIAAGMNVVIDSVTGKACEIGMTDGNIVVREA